jgi:hypothetical protein
MDLRGQHSGQIKRKSLWWLGNVLRDREDKRGGH